MIHRFTFHICLNESHSQRKVQEIKERTTTEREHLIQKRLSPNKSPPPLFLDVAAGVEGVGVEVIMGASNNPNKSGIGTISQFIDSTKR
jgi:hypothetical protein